MKEASEKTAKAFQFIVLLSLVSLCSDTVYEGARSISGPFLSELGASALIVGAVSGVGELLGYGLRLVSGRAADKTRAYWSITIVGYLINLVAVPALALANNWQMAAFLLIAERTGKAIRTPARDVMLSAAGDQLGSGFAFGLHRALDQIGAIAGPLLVAFIVFRQDGPRAAFIVLAIPAAAALAFLFVARFLFPRPGDLAIPSPALQANGLTRSFWIYLIAASLVGAGTMDFPLIAFHFKRVAIVSEAWIPVFYSVAMTTDAVAGFMLGKLFDRAGLVVLAGVSFLTAFVAPAVFLTAGGFWPLVGVSVWGVGMGAQGSIMRAVIAGLVSSERRGSAYGLFGLVYGICWFLGSLTLGFLYERSLWWLVIFSAAVQLLAVPLFLLVGRKQDTPV